MGWRLFLEIGCPSLEFKYYIIHTYIITVSYTISYIEKIKSELFYMKFKKCWFYKTVNPIRICTQWTPILGSDVDDPFLIGCSCHKVMVGPQLGQIISYIAIKCSGKGGNCFLLLCPLVPALSPVHPSPCPGLRKLTQPRLVTQYPTHWCPPCRQFTPLLAQACASSRSQG